MDIFKFFTSKTKPSKDVAKDRLKLVLIHDRGDFPKDVLEAMKKDLIASIEKYVEVDQQNIEIRIINKRDSQNKDSNPQITANLPFTNIKLRKNN